MYYFGVESSLDSIHAVSRNLSWIFPLYITQTHVMKIDNILETSIINTEWEK